MRFKQLVLCITGILLALPATASAQHSVARLWNDAMLEAIRTDFARPTVHSRNLFHAGIAMYDAWAAYDNIAETYFLGRTLGGYTTPFTGVPAPGNLQAAREEAISYAVFRLLKHRFVNSPGAFEALGRFDSLFVALGYDTTFTSTDYTTGDPAALGNYIGNQLIFFGLQDDANEQYEFANEYYEPVNPALLPEEPGNPDMVDPNRWQPLGFDSFVDQSGNPLPLAVPEFLGPEWGNVTPFALTEDDLTVYNRDGFDYWVYHDPGAPPYLDTLALGGLSEEYKWGHSLVSLWSSHLDPADSVWINISPGAIGNIQSYPTTFAEHRNFYDKLNGGDPSIGWPTNPSTGQPYADQWVPRADYARVLAEFWADGPESETPPGHWFTIVNYVNDHPMFEKRFKGVGPIVDDLEWDVKAYFGLGGVMHDAAVTAWGVKGWYDYARPISAIRYMAERGQCTDTTLTNFDPGGIPLEAGLIEVIQPGDSLALLDPANIGKIKLFAWRGPDYIADPESTYAGVGWILADNWWPYQRPTFVTPPFAGYVSGHSTFSRAAAEYMTLLTGDAFFPGGMGEFYAPMNEFLVFEDGPSVDVTLQWATYRDASDQTSLSRIWGGIHPPADDIPGRLMGDVIGPDAFDLAESYYNGTITGVGDPAPPTSAYVLRPNYPNPFNPTTTIEYTLPSDAHVEVVIHEVGGREVIRLVDQHETAGTHRVIWNGRAANGRDVSSGTYFYRLTARDHAERVTRAGKMSLIR
ncbi:MAG: T9SS type A sorting domain-containing protein [Gemmatimonadetes bacterium]|nr:T9SS type A sorting domain-containing protein [Gemmatimonadota bacterium]